MNKQILKFLLAASMLPCLSLMAQEEPVPQVKCGAGYVGGFGGMIYPYSVSVTQMGTAFFPDDLGGPLAVMAEGTMPGKNKGFGGMHVGYEWMNTMKPGFRLAPALELEGTYFADTTKDADVVNPTERLDAHEFMDSFPMRIGTLLANGILEFNNDFISPYIGVGVGVGFISIHGADSLQIDPLESEFNHFNSDTNDFQSVFTTQAKAGLRYRFLKHYRLSAEYRFIYLTSSEFTFGSTVYEDHVGTSPWTVKLGGMQYNTFTLGLDFLF